MEELKRQLEKGSIQKAYKALLSYMTGLRTHFVKKYGNSAVSGLYQGYMDMTYFALFPPSVKRCDLKVAIVFNYARSDSKPGSRHAIEEFSGNTGNCSRTATGTGTV